MHHETSFIIWIFFVLFILLVLTIDLGIFHKKSHSVGFKEAIVWSAVWIVLAIIFSGIIFYWRGQEDSILFLTGYLIEKSLSIDNLFVFYMIFNFFKVPDEYQHKVLYYGILGALIMRALFIWGGIALIEKFEWIIYIFGGLLIVSGIKMFGTMAEKDLEKSLIVRCTRKVCPTTSDIVNSKFFIHINDQLHITPLFLTLIFVEFSDLIFAIDSIPAIISITHDPFLVFSSNVFAILGLRALYFALKGFADMYQYLKAGLSIILIFIGLKMLSSHYVEIPVWITFLFIFLVMMFSLLLSIIKTKKKGP